MLVCFTGIQPLQVVAVEEGPIGHGDQRGEHDSTGVDKHHGLKRGKGVPDPQGGDRENHKQDLHQGLRALLTLPIHLQTSKTNINSKVQDEASVDSTGEALDQQKNKQKRKQTSKWTRQISITMRKHDEDYRSEK